MIRPGCWNVARPDASTTHTTQDGWVEYEERGSVVRIPVWTKIPRRMTTTCQYDLKETDPGCAGCFQVDGGSINKPSGN
jgi:hypothetical protein